MISICWIWSQCLQNIGDLGAVPSAVGVDNQSKKTVFAFAGSAKAMVLNHSNLSTLNASSLESYTLEEPANQVAIGDGFAVLYNDYNRSVHDVYHLNLETNLLTEYVVANPVSELQLTQSGSHAVAVMSPETSYGSGIDYYQDSRWGLAVMDLSSDESVSLVAESRPVGLALVEGADTAYALALLEGSETLLQVDLSNPTQAVPVEFVSPAVSISAMPDGQFVISHDQGLGMISFSTQRHSSLTLLSILPQSACLRIQNCPVWAKRSNHVVIIISDEHSICSGYTKV